MGLRVVREVKDHSRNLAAKAPGSVMVVHRPGPQRPGMPTYEVRTRFENELRHLPREKQGAFRAALRLFIKAFLEHERSGLPGSPRFPAALGVTPMAGHPHIWELRWAGDGRCTWEYGTPQHPGKSHVIWRRVGTHAIYDDP